MGEDRSVWEPDTNASVEPWCHPRKWSLLRLQQGVPSNASYSDSVILDQVLAFPEPQWSNGSPSQRAFSGRHCAVLHMPCLIQPHNHPHEEGCLVIFTFTDELTEAERG